MDSIARLFDYKNLEELYYAVGCGDMPMARIVNQLMLEEKDEEGFRFTTRPTVEPGAQSHDSVMVLGLKGLLTTMGKCCSPVPGDDIIGYITRGRGATIHRVDCPNMLRIRERERLVRVSWGEPKRTYPVNVQIKAYDRDGLLKDITTLISDEGINLGQVKAIVNQNIAIFDLTLEVREIDHLTRVLTRIEALPNILHVHRVRPG
jgi:GTP pyrophosphokinase